MINTSLIDKSQYLQYGRLEKQQRGVLKTVTNNTISHKVSDNQTSTFNDLKASLLLQKKQQLPYKIVITESTATKENTTHKINDKETSEQYDFQVNINHIQLDKTQPKPIDINVQKSAILDKDNQDPLSRPRSSQNINEDFHVEEKQTDTKSEKFINTEDKAIQNTREIKATVDGPKKRPISTTSVIQDIPKKSKVCDENGIEEYEWEDLDAEDANDPFMVSEYVGDIFEYLNHLEVITLPKKEELYSHKNIRQNNDILVNWLIKIHNKFCLLPETLYLAINLMHRFLSKELVQLDRLQLVGTSCLFIASKYEEVYSPSIAHFASETDGACSVEEIKEGERFILQTLGFNLNYPNPMNFLRRLSKADDYDIQSRTLAKFLMEISIVDFRFIGILPSLSAAAAMFLSRKMLGKRKWDGNLIHYSGGYTKEHLAPVCNMMMDYLVNPIIHDEFHRKYQSRRFMKASVISVQWAQKVRKNGYDIMTLHE